MESDFRINMHIYALCSKYNPSTKFREAVKMELHLKNKTYWLADGSKTL